MDLVVSCYWITKSFPKNEIYGITSQLQRVAVSVPSNIAEGRARKGGKEFLRYLSIAYGSIAELETLIQIANRLDYIDSGQLKQLDDQTTEIGKMINGLRKSIENKPET